MCASSQLLDEVNQTAPDLLGQFDVLLSADSAPADMTEVPPDSPAAGSTPDPEQTTNGTASEGPFADSFGGRLVICAVAGIGILVSAAVVFKASLRRRR